MTYSVTLKDVWMLRRFAQLQTDDNQHGQLIVAVLTLCVTVTLTLIVCLCCKPDKRCSDSLTESSVLSMMWPILLSWVAWPNRVEHRQETKLTWVTPHMTCNQKQNKYLLTSVPLPPNQKKRRNKSKNKWVGEGSGINKRRNKTKKHTIKLKINYASNIVNTNK